MVGGRIAGCDGGGDTALGMLAGATAELASCYDEAIAETERGRQPGNARADDDRVRAAHGADRQRRTQHGQLDGTMPLAWVFTASAHRAQPAAASGRTHAHTRSCYRQHAVDGRPRTRRDV